MQQNIDFTAFATKVINDYKNPIRKLPCVRTKSDFIKQKNDKEITHRLDNIKHVLSHLRVDRRNNRCQVEWLQNEQMFKILKHVGSFLPRLGFQNSNGKFIYPEEALSLLEMNRAELFISGESLSLQKAYAFIFATKSMSSYIVYRSLVLKNNIESCIRQEVYLKKLEKHVEKKIKSDHDDTTHASVPQFTDLITVNNIYNDVFEKLRLKGPKTNVETVEKECLYKVKCADDPKNYYDIHIITCQDLDAKVGFYRENNVNIYSYSHADCVSFVRFASINLPNV